MAKRKWGPRRWIAFALEQVDAEICEAAAGGHGIYSGGLASEGYAGGYRDALDDVLLLLNGVKPSRRRYYDASRDDPDE